MKTKNIILVLLSLLTLILLFNFIIPVITGSTQLLIVLSGSMHPVMRVGDMVVVESKSPDDIHAGDVIAYNDPGGTPNVMITHRVLSITEGEERLFQTKGDANEEQDSYLVPASKLVGEMVFVIPFAGYLPETTKSTSLFIVMIILPALLLVLDEVRNIIQYSNPIHIRKTQKNKRKIPRVPLYGIRSKLLVRIVSLSILTLAMLMLPTIMENEHTNLESEYVIKNNGYFQSVYVITPDDISNKLSITPWYIVLPQNGESVIISDEQLEVDIVAVPYALPVFWIIKLAQTNSYLPFITTIGIYTTFITFISLPLWYQRSKHRMHNKPKHRKQSLINRMRKLSTRLD
ncbi:MAG: signal peptidase I [Methanosarcinaceae archaeon]|nr:signal peptidase I [Methanosarcinaceae archaeon]